MKEIKVTKPYLPPIEEFIPYLKDIWSSRWISNEGPFHKQLESELSEYLGVRYVSLFTNGTLGLITAVKVLDLRGEIITTPFSFVATANSILWNNVRPVFVDIEPDFCNLDPAKIESAITSDTTAIMAVHVYGNPCKVDKLQGIADKYKLKIIYDAAHAFGVKINGDSILNFGDLSVLSFHATKVFNTFEGGAVICRDEQTKSKIDQLKNFGFTGTGDVSLPGQNGKMSEIQAAMGLLQLRYIDKNIECRKKIVEVYRNKLTDIGCLKMLDEEEDVSYNYSYFPIIIKAEKCAQTRDELFFELQKNGIFARRYFYPLITDFSCYETISKIDQIKFPVASEISKNVLCLPLYSELEIADVEYIANLIRKFLL